MIDEWRTATIEEVAEKVGMGPFGSSIKVETFVDEGVPIISGQHLSGTQLFDAEHNYITFEHAERLKNANVYRGDVIFTHAGNIGQVAYIPETSKFDRYVISQRQFYMRCDRSKVIPEFITYFFKTPEGQHRLLANTSSSGVPSIAQPVSYLKTIDMPVPPLPEQRAIAHILGTLDDKIELNRQMNQTLEAMAQALFKSWFVDFEPFRDQGMQDSPLGPIPRGWGVGRLDEVAAINQQSVTRDYPYHTIEYIDISSVSQGRLEGTTTYSLPDAPSRAKRLVKDGDTIWSTVRPNRKSYLFILSPKDNLIVSTGFAVLTPYLVPPSYLYSWVTTEEFVDYLAYNADGSAYPAVRPDRFAAVGILLPPDQILRDFDLRVNPLFRKMRANGDESHTLAAIRDTLLPKLLSGEIRVKDTEKFVEEKI